MVERPLHPLDHSSLQPGLCLFSLILVALDHYLIMDSENGHRTRALLAPLPEQGEGSLESIGTAALYREVLRLPPHFVALPATHGGGLTEAAYPSSRGSEHTCPYGPCGVTFKIFLDLRVGDEVLLYELRSRLPLDPEPGGETDRGHAVDDPEAYCLGRGVLLGGDFLLRDAVHLRRRRHVEVLALLECPDHSRVT